MATVTLTHCVPVKIHGSDVPFEARLQIAVGGGIGDGVVDIISGPAPADPTCAPSGSPTTSLSPACKSLTLHYHRSESGPMAVDVTFTLILT